MSCENCRKGLSKGEDMMGCKTCRTTLCLRCYDNPAHADALNCPGRHGLRAYSAPTADIACDSCKKQLAKGDDMRGCKKVRRPKQLIVVVAAFQPRFRGNAISAVSAPSLHHLYLCGRQLYLARASLPHSSVCVCILPT